MGRKEEYKEKNLQYLQVLSTQEGICPLPCNMFYKVLQTGTGTVSPTIRSIVTVHYRGSLINGKEFDNSYDRNCPEAFRLCDVIEGWQLALQRMHVGDKWVVYIPYTMGYGNRTSGPIPAFFIKRIHGCYINPVCFSKRNNTIFRKSRLSTSASSCDKNHHLYTSSFLYKYTYPFLFTQAPHTVPHEYLQMCSWNHTQQFPYPGTEKVQPLRCPHRGTFPHE